MNDPKNTRAAVAKLYDTYPFPPDPLSDDVPPGYNWRWHWLSAYSFCTGRKPPRQSIRILDAGCGTGSGTDYLIHLNPDAEIVAIDLSAKAIDVARERVSRSGVLLNRSQSVKFIQMPLEAAGQLPGQFDLINCVGVLHHLSEPVKGIQALASKLAPGGLLHVFVYSELGRWEISLMQRAISMIQGDRLGDYPDGVKVGRELFDSLPENNRLVKYEKERWAFENKRDEAFADMYVHPQEINYNIETLFELIEASGLKFIGFSNPQYWDINRLIGRAPDLLARTEKLSQKELYRLIELLDPQISHYEFFLGQDPIEPIDWSSDETFLAATPELNPCINGWPSRNILDRDYQMVNLSPGEFEFLQGCEGKTTVGEILKKVDLEISAARALLEKQLIILTPDRAED